MKAVACLACLAVLVLGTPAASAQKAPAKPAAKVAAKVAAKPAPKAAPAAPAPAPDPGAREYSYLLSAGEARGAIDQGNTVMVAGYVSGVMDALMREREFCVPANSNAATIAANAYRVLAQQPRDSLAPAGDVVSVYLVNDYPCRK